MPDVNKFQAEFQRRITDAINEKQALYDSAYEKLSSATQNSISIFAAANRALVQVGLEGSHIEVGKIEFDAEGNASLLVKVEIAGEVRAELEFSKLANKAGVRVSGLDAGAVADIPATDDERIVPRAKYDPYDDVATIVIVETDGEALAERIAGMLNRIAKSI